MDKPRSFWVTLTIDVIAALVTAFAAFGLVTNDEAAAINQVAVAVAPIVALVATAVYNRDRLPVVGKGSPPKYQP